MLGANSFVTDLVKDKKWFAFIKMVGDISENVSGYEIYLRCLQFPILWSQL